MENNRDGRNEGEKDKKRGRERRKNEEEIGRTKKRQKRDSEREERKALPSAPIPVMPILPCPVQNDGASLHEGVQMFAEGWNKPVVFGVQSALPAFDPRQMSKHARAKFKMREHWQDIASKRKKLRTKMQIKRMESAFKKGIDVKNVTGSSAEKGEGKTWKCGKCFVKQPHGVDGAKTCCMCCGAKVQRKTEARTEVGTFDFVDDNEGDDDETWIAENEEKEIERKKVLEQKRIKRESRRKEKEKKKKRVNATVANKIWWEKIANVEEALAKERIGGLEEACEWALVVFVPEIRTSTHFVHHDKCCLERKEVREKHMAMVVFIQRAKCQMASSPRLDVGCHGACPMEMAETMRESFNVKVTAMKNDSNHMANDADPMALIAMNDHPRLEETRKKVLELFWMHTEAVMANFAHCKERNLLRENFGLSRQQAQVMCELRGLMLAGLGASVKKHKTEFLQLVGEMAVSIRDFVVDVVHLGNDANCFPISEERDMLLEKFRAAPNPRHARNMVHSAVQVRASWCTNLHLNNGNSSEESESMLTGLNTLLDMHQWPKEKRQLFESKGLKGRFVNIGITSVVCSVSLHVSSHWQKRRAPVCC